MTGVEFLGKIMDIFPDAKRVLLTDYGDTEAVMKSINKVKEQSNTYCYRSQYRVFIGSLKHEENLHYLWYLINLMISINSEIVLQ